MIQLHSLGCAATFVGAGHPLDRPFVVVVLAHGEGEDPHLPGQKSEWRKDQTGPKPLTVSRGQIYGLTA